MSERSEQLGVMESRTKPLRSSCATTHYYMSKTKYGCQSTGITPIEMPLAGAEVDHFKTAAYREDLDSFADDERTKTGMILIGMGTSFPSQHDVRLASSIIPINIASASCETQRLPALSWEPFTRCSIFSLGRSHSPRWLLSSIHHQDVIRK